MNLKDFATNCGLDFAKKWTERDSYSFLSSLSEKLSETESDKNFLKRGEVDVIYFTPLIKTLFILMAK